MQLIEAECGGIQPCPPSSAQQTEILVSVRRDFPIRSSEKFGDWRWSDSEGNRTADPLSWSLVGQNLNTVPENAQLRGSRTDTITGWSLGRTTLGAPGHFGNQFTTDREHPILAQVELWQGTNLLQRVDTAGADGEATIDTTGLSGACMVRVLPANHDDLSPVGPYFFAEQTGEQIIYRSLQIPVNLSNGRIVSVDDPYDPPGGRTCGRIGNRACYEPTSTMLPISLKPIWWRLPGSANRVAGVDIDMFVIHCTSGARLGNALNQWRPRPSGAHYVLDIDGHLIKMVNEDKRVSHVAGGWDRWERDRHNVSNNDRSIGIEIINPLRIGSYSNGSAYVASDEPQPYTDEQYRALSRLLKDTVNAFPKIAHRIIGHSDVACGPTDKGVPRDRYHIRRNWDPGNRFAWEKLEAQGLGMMPSTGPQQSNCYDGVFELSESIEIQIGDYDPKPGKDGILGGDTRPGFVGAPIHRIKTDLRHIGYSLRNTNGKYDLWLAGAVDRFKRHFFSCSRGCPTGGNIDLRTAMTIRDIASQI